MKINLSVSLLSALTILLWGLWGFFGKLALNKGMPPLSLFFVEVISSLFCAIVVILILFQQGGSHPWNETWSKFGLFSGSALAIGLLFYYLALDKGQAIIVIPLTAIYPAVAILLSFALLGERPSLAQWLGIVFIIAGVVLLLSGPLESE